VWRGSCPGVGGVDACCVSVAGGLEADPVFASLEAAGGAGADQHPAATRSATTARRQTGRSVSLRGIGRGPL
jgi:hypothetical protein